MFYFLIILGCTLIVLGIYMDGPKSRVEPNTSYKDIEELHLLNARIEFLERAFMEEIPIVGELEEEAEDEIMEEDGSNPEETKAYGLEKYDLLRKYEEEGHSLEEICILLNMNKGEVILLKNLYKNYSI